MPTSFCRCATLRLRNLGNLANFGGNLAESHSVVVVSYYSVVNLLCIVIRYSKYSKSVQNPEDPKIENFQDFRPGGNKTFNREWNFQASHTARALIVGNSWGRDWIFKREWSFQARMKLSCEKPENFKRSSENVFFKIWALRECSDSEHSVILSSESLRVANSLQIVNSLRVLFLVCRAPFGFGGIVAWQSNEFGLVWSILDEFQAKFAKCASFSVSPKRSNSERLAHREMAKASLNTYLLACLKPLS